MAPPPDEPTRPETEPHPEAPPPEASEQPTAVQAPSAEQATPHQERPAGPQPQTPEIRYRALAAVVAASVAVVVIVNAAERYEGCNAKPTVATPPVPAPGPSGPAAPTPNIPTPVSKYAQCRELADVYGRMQRKLGCAESDWVLGAGICEFVYDTRRDCVPAFEAVARCVKAQPESSWVCAADDRLRIKEPFCKEYTSAIAACGAKQQNPQRGDARDAAPPR